LCVNTRPRGASHYRGVPCPAVDVSPPAAQLSRAATGESPALTRHVPATRGLAGLVWLIRAAVAGNYYAIPLFFGLDFIAGSIFALLAVQLYGPLWGTAA